MGRRPTEGIETRLIALLYEERYGREEGDATVQYDDLPALCKCAEQELHRAETRLSEEGLVDWRGKRLFLTRVGIDYAEQRGIAPSGLCERNRQVRRAILRACKHLWDETGQNWFHWKNIVKPADVTEGDFDTNEDWLLEHGLLRTGAAGFFELTAAGEDAARAVRC